MTQLKDLADAIRSANAGASLRTFDIMFERKDVFDHVWSSETITPDLIGSLYSVPADKVQVWRYEPAYTIKITMPRTVIAGSPSDTDIDGKQQHAPLMEIDIPG